METSQKRLIEGTHMPLDLNSRRRSLRNRLLFWVWLVSSVTTFTFTTFQLYSDYSREKNGALHQIEVINKNYIPSIKKSLWDYNFKYLDLQLISLRNLPYVKFVDIKSDDINSKKLQHPDSLQMFSIPLEFQQQEIGTLEIGLDIIGIQKSYISKSVNIFLIQALKTLIVCFLLLRIFESIIMKHVILISQYLKNFDLNDNKSLKLHRSSKINDELTLLVHSINQLKEELCMSRKEFLDLNKDLEAKVEERTQMLEEERARSIHSAKLASLGEMAGGIAHEINNPLAIISSTVQFLKKRISKDKLSSEDLKESLETIDSTVLRTSKIITGLRTVSHHSDSFVKKEVVIKDLLEDVLGLCSARFKNHGIHLYIELTDELYAHKLSCDRVQLSQVLINLFGNSFDAIQSCNVKWIRLELLIAGEFDIIKISDSGTGISENIAKKIFNPFFTSKEVGKGTGLGLSISKSIMDKHGGVIELDSSEKNTCFVLKLPKAKLAA